MTKAVFLLLNLVLASYNVGTIWAHEVDIFRTWRLLIPKRSQRFKLFIGKSFLTGSLFP